MPTTIDPIIRQQGPSRIEVSYDRYAGKLNVTTLLGNPLEQYQGRETIILGSVEFHRREGERQGCAGSGYLGYVRGEPIQSGAQIDITRLQQVKWDYSKFTNPQGERVASARYIVISGSSMLAEGIVTD